MVYNIDYNKDLFKQVQEVMKKCDNLTSEIKKKERNSKKKNKN